MSQQKAEVAYNIVLSSLLLFSDYQEKKPPRARGYLSCIPYTNILATLAQHSGTPARAHVNSREKCACTYTAYILLQYPLGSRKKKNVPFRFYQTICVSRAFAKKELRMRIYIGTYNI